jgi:hypothetical protein
MVGTWWTYTVRSGGLLLLLRGLGVARAWCCEGSKAQEWWGGVGSEYGVALCGLVGWRCMSWLTRSFDALRLCCDRAW